MNNKKTQQTNTWTGEFGADYTERNRFANDKEFNELYVKRYGRSRDEINKEWLAQIPKNSRILEVGTNIANQLRALESIGYENLYGIEIQQSVVEEVRRSYPQFGVLQSPGQDIPFKDNFFDMVFTNNVLIHVSPESINDVMDEIYRVSKRWIWGFEYYAPEFTEINYHGHENLLWKADYAALFQQRFPDLKLVRSQEVPCLDEPGNMDKLYLLEKQT